MKTGVGIRKPAPNPALLHDSSKAVAGHLPSLSYISSLKKKKKQPPLRIEKDYLYTAYQTSMVEQITLRWSISTNYSHSCTLLVSFPSHVRSISVLWSVLTRVPSVLSPGGGSFCDLHRARAARCWGPSLPPSLPPHPPPNVHASFFSPLLFRSTWTNHYNNKY